MSKCLNCGVELLDSTNVCPLCKCIAAGEVGTGSPTYPYAAEKGQKKMQRALNIYTFAAIVAEGILVAANIFTNHSVWWSVMTAAFFVYGFVTLKFSIQKNSSYRFKMMLQSLLAISVLILIDVLVGFHGWSLNYVLPAAFILIDAAIVVLMIVNHRDWQSYMPMQILIIVLSIIPFILRRFGISEDTYVSTISFVIAILVFAGTLIIGGKRARNELYRRFHV